MSGVRYRAESADELVRRPLDDLHLIYHRRSGQTHLVASPVPEMLDALAGQALDADGLCALLSQDYDLGDPQQAHAELMAHLDMLDALGLVRRV